MPAAADVGRMDDMTTTLEALREALDDVDRPVATTSEVAEHHEQSRPTVGGKLAALEAADLIETSKVGRSRVWWEDTPAVTSTKTPASTSTKREGESRQDEATPAKTPASTSTKDLRDRLETVVQEQREKWDDDARQGSRAKAAENAVWYVSELNGASRQELIDEVEPRHPVEGQDGRTWWRRTVKPVLKQVATYSNISKEWELDER